MYIRHVSCASICTRTKSLQEIKRGPNIEHRFSGFDFGYIIFKARFKKIDSTLPYNFAYRLLGCISMTTKQLVLSRNSLCCNSTRSDHFYPKIDTSPIQSSSDRKDRQTKIERDRERADNCVHKSACLVACQIGRKGEQKTKNKKGVGDEKRDRDREDCGAVISEREYRLFLLLCLPTEREGV